MLVGEIGNEFINQGPEMTDITIPNLEKLHRIFREHGPSNPILLTFNCFQCENSFELELHRTGSGFGINGGMLFVTKDDQLLGKCMHCYKQTD